MKLLRNGNKRSNINVSPADYCTNPDTITRSWRIYYRYYDATKDINKAITIRGFNEIKSWKKRCEAVAEIIADESDALDKRFYNPITKSYDIPKEESEYLQRKVQPIIQALDITFDIIDLSKKSKSDLKSVWVHFRDALVRVGVHDIPLEDFSRVHARKAFDSLCKVRDYSDKRHNSARANLMILFNELVYSDLLAVNPFTGIKKKKVRKSGREVITQKELSEVLDKVDSDFKRFIIIFFHSGCRISELLRMRVRDVDLGNNEFKVEVRKGGLNEVQTRAITAEAFDYWRQSIEGAGNSRVIFSEGLNPGKSVISYRQIVRRWRVHVKEKLGIGADFYTLKHLHTQLIVEAYGTDIAAQINGHKSAVMNSKHYDTLREQRELEAMKQINIKVD